MDKSPLALWEEHRTQGKRFFAEGDFSRAEMFLRLALDRARKFRVKDLRLAVSLLDLSECYLALKRAGESENLYKESIRIMRQILGSTHELVVKTQERYQYLKGQHQETDLKEDTPDIMDSPTPEHP